MEGWYIYRLKRYSPLINNQGKMKQFEIAYFSFVL